MDLRKIALIGILGLMASCLYAGQDVRFSDGWKFYPGDASGAQQTSFSDVSWTSVYLPHTPRIELNYATSSIYMGVCWYRKSFTPALPFQGKKIYIEFGGAMQTAQVYLNGSLLATHLGGYTPFVLDISKSLNFGASNVLAVRLDNNPSAGFPPGNSNPDFLYFGGLYRDVYLHVLDSLHISNALLADIPGGGGIFVSYSSVSTSSANIQVTTHVMNEYATAKSCMVTTTLLDSNGTSVESNSTTAQNLAAGAASTFTQSLTVSGPHLWSPNTPYLYKLKSQVYSGSTLVDTSTTTIGIRTIAFSHSGGLQINGQRIIGRGANRHQAYPYLGNAAPISGQFRDALRMKQYGFNFVRMCHYVQSQGFVDACDKYGVLGMACLPGWQYNAGTADFTNNCEAALRAMVRCYRNHPSVVVYETSLNEASYTDAWATQMNTAAHQEYPGNQMFTTGWQTTQFDVYCAASQGGVRSTTDSRPIIICEYGDWDLGCVYGTSITGCADRIVRSDGEAALLRQATNHANQLSINRGLSWLSADALWSAFDYQSWSVAPYTTSGSLDIFRIPKYSAWFYKSQRSPADTLEPGPAKGGPMVFIASSWTSSSAIPVKVYSNCDQVSLYLNNTLVSTQSPTTGTNLEHPPFSFSIPSFQSGTLRADGLIGGAVKATYSVSTPGIATKVSVAIDTANMQFTADGSDIALIYASILDGSGTVLPTASTNITFTVSSGPGDLVGTNPVAAQAGIATIMLRSRATGGAITVTATTSGLATGMATVTSIVSPTTGIASMSGTRPITQNSGFSIGRIGSSLRVKLPRGEGGEQTVTNLTLYNAQGKLLGQWTLLKRDNIVPVGALSHGVYFGRIDNGPLVFVKE